MSSALMLSNDLGAGTYLERVDLRQSMSEHWLRDRIFAYPQIIPMDRIDPGLGYMVSVCREFPLSKYGSSVFVDMFGVTCHGRPVLIECKLWRNPQARREVIAQLLEYAALFRRLSYADLTAVLKSRYGMTGDNPLFGLVSGMPGASSEEAFSDMVAQCLARGDINLIIAGDGIREDTAAIAEHLSDRGAKLTLLELQMWQDRDGHRLLVPQIPFRTEVLRQRVLVDESDRPLAITVPEDTDLLPPGAGASESRMANRAFWDAFIRSVRFDHPDQPSPTHGGNNWVRIKLPPPGRWITGYRYQDRIGLSFVQDESVDLNSLLDEADQLREETGLDILDISPGKQDGVVSIGISQPVMDVGDEPAQIEWLSDMSNRLVNSLRPRLSQIDDRD